MVKFSVQIPWDMGEWELKAINDDKVVGGQEVNHITNVRP